jgi:hypothetical protein
MQRTLTLFFLLIQASFTVYSQNEIIFKIKYKPETKYSQTTEQIMHTILSYSGSKEILQKLKEKNVQNPTLSDKASTIESVTKTGKLTDKANFPVTMEILSTMSSDGKKEIPDGMIMYGQGTMDNLPTLDSIYAPGIDDEFKKILLTAMQGIFSQVTFPDKKLKVGEKFSQDAPFLIPLGGMTLDMTTTTVYKLVSVEKGIAKFDVTQSYNIKSEIFTYAMKASGKGKGQLFYDLANNFPIKNQMAMDLKLNTKVKEVVINVKLKNSYFQSTIITINNQ